MTDHIIINFINVSLHGSPLQNEAVMKGFSMFDSCIDDKTIEALDAKPLLDLIKAYGSWNITDENWTEESWDFMDVFVKIQKYLSIAPLFNMYVSADLRDSTKNIIVVRLQLFNNFLIQRTFLFRLVFYNHTVLGDFISSFFPISRLGVLYFA